MLCILGLSQHQHLFTGQFEVLVLSVALVAIKVFQVNPQ